MTLTTTQALEDLAATWRALGLPDDVPLVPVDPDGSEVPWGRATGLAVDCGPENRLAVLTVHDTEGQNNYRTLLGGPEGTQAWVVTLREGEYPNHGPREYRDKAGRVVATNTVNGRARVADLLWPEPQVPPAGFSVKGWEDLHQIQYPTVPGWPRPRDLPESGCPVPYPVDALPDLMAQAVREVAESRQVDPAIPACAFLAVAAGLVGSRTLVPLYRSGGRTLHRCTGYWLVAAPTGTGKSPAIDPAHWALADAQRAVSDEYLRQRPTWATEHELLKRKRAEGIKATQAGDGPPPAELATMLARLTELEELLNRPPRVYADDATPEALEQLLADNGGLLTMWNDEGAYLDQLLGRYSGRPNLAAWLKGWDGKTLAVDRRDKDKPPLLVESPWLTVFAAVQPVFLNEAAGVKGMQERGALARLLIAHPPTAERVYSSDTRGEDVAVPAWNQRVQELRRQEPQTLTVSSGAYDLWDQWRNDATRELRPSGRYEPVREFTPKYFDYAGRIAGLLARLEGGAVVRPDHMARATRIVEYHLASVLHVFDEAGGHLQLARRLLAWMRDGQAEDLWTPRQYQRKGPGKGRNAAEVYAALEVLEDHGWIATNHPDGFSNPGRAVGRKAPDVELHPYLLAGEDL